MGSVEEKENLINCQVLGMILSKKNKNAGNTTKKTQYKIKKMGEPLFKQDEIVIYRDLLFIVVSWFDKKNKWFYNLDGRDGFLLAKRVPEEQMHKCSLNKIIKK